MKGQHPLYKWSVATPTILGRFPAAALMFRKGYIKQGEPVVHEERTLASSGSATRRSSPRIRSSTPTATGAMSAGPIRIRGRGSTRWRSWSGRSRSSTTATPRRPGSADLSRYIDHPKKVVRSITGEIALDYGNGLCTLERPKAQGACGFLAKAGVIRLGDVAIRSQNGYATVVVVSMDDRPLASSRKILVQVGTSARPTGWWTREAEFPGEDGKTTVKGFQIVKTGTPPWRVVNTEVGLVVRNPALDESDAPGHRGLPRRGSPRHPRRGGLLAQASPEHDVSHPRVVAGGSGRDRDCSVDILTRQQM